MFVNSGLNNFELVEEGDRVYLEFTLPIRFDKLVDIAVSFKEELYFWGIRPVERIDWVIEREGSNECKIRCLKKIIDSHSNKLTIGIFLQNQSTVQLDHHLLM